MRIQHNIPAMNSYRNYNQKHREEWEEKRETRSSVIRELVELTDNMGRLSDSDLRAKLSDLRTKINSPD